ncbi:MAG: DUF2905 family protein [Peptostreptococcaceae bacterium]|nr:DUF2905 family protein [Peptostreptococcaceae bacterium]
MGFGGRTFVIAFYFPLVSSIIVSIILKLLLNLFSGI